MAKILGYTVHSWPKGVIEYPVQSIGLIEAMPGFDDDAMAAGGWKLQPQEITTITNVAGTISSAETVMLAYHRLHQQVGQVEDQFGRIFNNVTVMRAVARPMQTYSSTLWWVVCEWLLKFPAQRLNP